MNSSLHTVPGACLRLGACLLAASALLLFAATATADCAEQAPRDCCYGPVQPGQTLWSIAESLRPGEDVSIQQTALAIRRLNPEAFEEGNLYLLRACSYLETPSRQEALSVSRQFAIAELLRHRQLLSQRKPPPAKRPPPAEKAPAVPAAAASTLSAAAASSPTAAPASPAASPAAPAAAPSSPAAAVSLVPSTGTASLTADDISPVAAPPTPTAAAVPDPSSPAAGARQPEIRARDPRRAVSYSDGPRSWQQRLRVQLFALGDAWQRLTDLATADNWRRLAASPLFISLLLIASAYLLLFSILRILGSGTKRSAAQGEDFRALLNRARLLAEVPEQRQEAQSLLYTALLSEEEDIRREAEALLARITDTDREPGADR